MHARFILPITVIALATLTSASFVTMQDSISNEESIHLERRAPLSLSGFKASIKEAGAKFVSKFKGPKRLPAERAPLVNPERAIVPVAPSAPVRLSSSREIVPVSPVRDVPVNPVEAAAAVPKKGLSTTGKVAVVGGVAAGTVGVIKGVEHLNETPNGQQTRTFAAPPQFPQDQQFTRTPQFTQNQQFTQNPQF